MKFIIAHNRLTGVAKVYENGVIKLETRKGGLLKADEKKLIEQVLVAEIRTGSLTPDEKKLLDEKMSKIAEVC